MAKEDYKNIWVYIEKNDQDEIKRVSLELLNGGKILAEKTKEQVVAVVIGADNGEIVKTVGTYGVDKIITVEEPGYKDFSTEGYAYALKALVEKYKPSALLFGSTTDGKDLSARLAGKLHTSIAADSTAASVNDSEEIEWTRSIYGGKFLTTLSSQLRPQIGAVRPGVFAKEEPDQTKSAEIIKEDIKIPEKTIRTKIINIIKSAETSGVNLDEAKIIVAGGRGVGNSENFQLLTDLANLLNGGVGGTRPAVDAGWISSQAQIGLSGKKVSPDIYIACGISGAIQHVQGIKSSKIIIAINRDADAPIFEIADYGIVGDLFKVLPVLIKEIKKTKGTMAS